MCLSCCPLRLCAPRNLRTSLLGTMRASSSVPLVPLCIETMRFDRCALVLRVELAPFYPPSFLSHRLSFSATSFPVETQSLSQFHGDSPLTLTGGSWGKAKRFMALFVGVIRVLRFGHHFSCISGDLLWKHCVSGFGYTTIECIAFCIGVSRSLRVCPCPPLPEPRKVQQNTRLFLREQQG